MIVSASVPWLLDDGTVRWDVLLKCGHTTMTLRKKGTGYPRDIPCPLCAEDTPVPDVSSETIDAEVPPPAPPDEAEGPEAPVPVLPDLDGSPGGEILSSVPPDPRPTVPKMKFSL